MDWDGKCVIENRIEEIEKLDWRLKKIDREVDWDGKCVR